MENTLVRCKHLNIIEIHALLKVFYVNFIGFYAESNIKGRS